MDILSTRAVAQMLGISEATVKRWADANVIPCFRTSGGHRKFRLRDVKAFLANEPLKALDGEGREGAFGVPVHAAFGSMRTSQATMPTAFSYGAPSGPRDPTRDEKPVGVELTSFAVASEGWAEARETLQKLALAADVDGLVSFIASEHLGGSSLARIFDQIVAPALRDIGERWTNGSLSVAQEHMASGALADALARIRPLVERRARPRELGRALCATFGDEHHDLGARMTALVLTDLGYRATMVGANIPVGDLALLVAGERPALVAVSASVCARPEVLRGDVGVLSSAAAAGRTRVIFGGPGFAALDGVIGSHRTYGSLEDLAARPPHVDA